MVAPKSEVIPLLAEHIADLYEIQLSKERGEERKKPTKTINARSDLSNALKEEARGWWLMLDMLAAVRGDNLLVRIVSQSHMT
jgi:hypothetical protein